MKKQGAQRSRAYPSHTRIFAVPNVGVGVGVGVGVEQAQLLEAVIREDGSSSRARVFIAPGTRWVVPSYLAPESDRRHRTSTCRQAASVGGAVAEVAKGLACALSMSGAFSVACLIAWLAR